MQPVVDQVSDQVPHFLGLALARCLWLAVCVAAYRLACGANVIYWFGSKENSMFHSFLFFDRTGADAMHFYNRTPGGEIERMMTNGQSPMKDQLEQGSEDRILYACLRIGETRIMASDSMVGQPYEGMKGFSLSLSYPTAIEAERMFELLADCGTVTMPLADTFWSESFGMLVDRFGRPWMLSGGAAKTMS